MIEHVSFEVTLAQAEGCAGFYELLGFARVEPPAGLGDRSIWLVSGATAIHLMHTDRDGNAVGDGAARSGHVALVVDRYEAVLGLLRAAGVTVDERTAYWGSPRSCVHDPAGNQIELMAFAPEFSAPTDGGGSS